MKSGVSEKNQVKSGKNKEKGGKGKPNGRLS
jgi:hypothetical protein